ncbi:MAG: SIMPL domain-containing protein [Rikenellaceae bacterium]
MRKIFSLFVAILMVSGLSAQSIGGVQNFVEVAGEATIKVAPNNFKLMIIVDESADRGRSSVSNIEAMMVSSLIKIGVDTNSKLKMSDLSSASLRNRGQLAKVTYTLELDSAQMVVDSVNALRELGITSVDVVSVGNLQIEEHRAEARARAVANARERGLQIGEALGQRVGECLQIIDNGGNYLPNMAQMMRSNMESLEHNLEFADIEITQRVVAKFLLVVSSETKREVIK